MKPGSVIVDLAVETGGNCELAEAGTDVRRHGVLILGPVNLPSTVPVHASQMYAKNVRSEEHTSELQSQSNLVCRLLLEKKKEQYDAVSELHYSPPLTIVFRTCRRRSHEGGRRDTQDPPNHRAATERPAVLTIPLLTLSG